MRLGLGVVRLFIHDAVMPRSLELKRPFNNPFPICNN